MLVVADDGPGIDAADRERVFERYARLDDARSCDAGGTGLGLAIVREIVRAHQGAVTVEDPVGSDGGASAGTGARLVVRLPAERSPKARITGGPAPGRSLSPMSSQRELGAFEVDEYVFQALRVGASGFIGKGADGPEQLLPPWAAGLMLPGVVARGVGAGSHPPGAGWPAHR